MKRYKSISFLTFIFICFCTLSAQPNTTINFNKLDTALQTEFGSKFAFSVLVGDEEKILFRNSYGYIDKQKTKRTNNQSLFNIASVSKSFTAVGIMLLADQNKLRLTDTIGMYFKNVPADKRTIRINHLLCHKSGFHQNYVCDGIENSEDAIAALLSDTLDFLPGESFYYSDQNYEMLALIIEQVTHSTFENFIRKEILKPLKMENTFFWNEVAKSKNIADKNEKFMKISLTRNWGYIGSGGIYSTPEDLYKFIHAVVYRQLISKYSTDLMFYKYHTIGTGMLIGYGWFRNDTTPWGSKEIWTRGNEDWGHNAVLRWFTDKKTIIIVCTNSGDVNGIKQVTGNKVISSYIADYLWPKK